MTSWEPTTDQYPATRESPPQPISLRFIFSPSCHPLLGLPSVIFLFAYPPKPCTCFSPLLACRMPHPPHSPLFDLPNNIWWWVQITELPVVQFYPFSRYFIPRRSKYSPQHPVLKHPQSVLFPWNVGTTDLITGNNGDLLVDLTVFCVNGSSCFATYWMYIGLIVYYGRTEMQLRCKSPDVDKISPNWPKPEKTYHVLRTTNL
jgi:hypothetical protein